MGCVGRSEKMPSVEHGKRFSHLGMCATDDTTFTVAPTKDVKTTEPVWVDGGSDEHVVCGFVVGCGEQSTTTHG